MRRLLVFIIGILAAWLGTAAPAMAAAPVANNLELIHVHTHDGDHYTSFSAQRQGRHVLGARQYGGGSYFNSADDAQRVLDDFHTGAAQVLGTK